MSRFKIDLPSGESFIEATIPLGDKEYRFELDWSYNGNFYRVNMYDGDTPVIEGKGLHPGVDLLGRLKLGIGKLYLEGSPATVENLGTDNRLIYETV